MEKKKPDQVVYKEGDGWVAKSLPYGTDLGAPSIQPDNIDLWKSKSSIKANKHFKTKYEEIKKEYENLISEYKWSELVYNAAFSFEPIIGETYHLYLRKNGEVFLSLINPNEWNMDFLGSFRLNSEHKWIKEDGN